MPVNPIPGLPFPLRAPVCEMPETSAAVNLLQRRGRVYYCINGLPGVVSHQLVQVAKQQEHEGNVKREVTTPNSKPKFIVLQDMDVPFEHRQHKYYFSHQ
jgi:hypothetical protein